jgi:protein tyrosine phosphatase (PTP) superfamily phosphohydrolase (DUF442 family)
MDFSAITDDLFIGTTPSVSDYDHLRELGVQLVINMRIEHHQLRAQPKGRLTKPVLPGPDWELEIRQAS